MANRITDNKQDRELAREGETTTSSRTIWHQIVVRHSSVWHPPTDVYRTEDRLIVLIEIAGMREHDFQVVLQNRLLTVSGVRHHLGGLEDVAYHQMEIERGAFRTEIHLPWNVDRSQVNATYQDGLLRIELPRALSTAIHVLNITHNSSDEA